MRNGVLLFCVAGFLHGLAGAAAGPPGSTVGIMATQRFDEDETLHRGSLVVVEVWDGTPAAAAGVQRGDFIVAIDGVPVAGKDAFQAFRNQLHGGIGGTVHLTLLRPQWGVKKLEVDLKRVAYPPLKNPPFETFGYTVPASWSIESYSFPLPFAPRLAYRGIEDVLFVPDFDDRTAPGYHSLDWVWWLDGRPAVDAAMLRSTLFEYFQGISQERGTNHQFTPQMDKVTATVSAVAEGPAAAARSAARAFRGEAVTYDTHGDLITLQVEVEVPPCPDASHTAILFRLSPQAREAPIWKDLRAVTGSFRCRRAS